MNEIVSNSPQHENHSSYILSKAVRSTKECFDAETPIGRAQAKVLVIRVRCPTAEGRSHGTADPAICIGSIPISAINSIGRNAPDLQESINLGTDYACQPSPIMVLPLLHNIGVARKLEQELNPVRFKVSTVDTKQGVKAEYIQNKGE